jgi:hypothetical protein
MEWFNEKVLSALGTIIGAFGGYVVYEKRKVDKRISKIEAENDTLRIEIAVMKSQYKDIQKDIKYIRLGLDKIIERI